MGFRFTPIAAALLAAVLFVAAPLAGQEQIRSSFIPRDIVTDVPSDPPSTDAVIKYEETFDSTTIPAGWQVIDNDGSGSAWSFEQLITFTSGDSIQPESGQSFFFSNFGNANGAGLIDEWLISPRLPMIEAGDELSFYAGAIDGQYKDSLKVLVSTTDSLPGSFTEIAYFKVDGPTGAWNRYTFDLSAFAGSEVFVAINYYIVDGGPLGTHSDNVWFDHIALESTTPATDKLLLTEIVVTPTGGEFVEIYNPGAAAVDLSNYYLTDATFEGGSTYYYQIVEGAGGGGGFGDFHARFPSGASIAPGEYQTIAMNGTDFATEYGVSPTYELYDTDANIADMLEAFSGSINGQGGLTNGDEVVILYYWDGASDLVKDVDYLLYNSGSPAANNEAVDKSGVRIDGPDANADSSMYLNDTPIANQISAPSHDFGFSVHRIDFSEGAQTASGGNGVTGADETSEDLANTFTNNSLPSPNASYIASTARLQVIHNAADPAAAVVDVYLNGGILLDDFAFRAATPFIDAPAGQPINVGIAPGNSGGVADTLANFVFNLAGGETYVAIANGVLDPAGFEGNPDGRSTAFGIFVNPVGQEASSDPSLVEFSVLHGATDAPFVDVVARDVVTLVNNAGYGDITPYIGVPANAYTLDVFDSTGTVLVASFAADLSGLAGGAAQVFASGFLTPGNDQNGEAFGIFAALPDGNVVEFPAITTARLQVIHNAADPAAAVVDVYLDGGLLLDDFAFRAATPFIDAPAGQVINVGVAGGNSGGAADTLVNFPLVLTPGETYVAVANGVLDPSAFEANPDGRSTAFTLFIDTDARESSSTAGEVELAVVHGATDAITVDVIARGVGTLVNNAAYGDYTGYFNVPAQNYVLDVADSTGSSVAASFDAPLSGFADSALVVLASGFLTPGNDQNGEPFALIAVTASGNVIVLPGVTGIDRIDNAPRTFALDQNYPNPFNPSTTIRYSIPQAEQVTLKVFNMLGQEVVTLVRGQQQQPGVYQVNFDASALASGLYFYQIQAGSFSQTRRMVLLK